MGSSLDVRFLLWIKILITFHNKHWFKIFYWCVIYFQKNEHCKCTAHWSPQTNSEHTQTSKSQVKKWKFYQFSSVTQLCLILCDPMNRTAACQASLSITDSQSPPKCMSIESMMPSNHLILCHPRLLLPSIFPSIRVFSNDQWPRNSLFATSSQKRTHTFLLYTNEIMQGVCFSH